jgi:hypothetical protein
MLKLFRIQPWANNKKRWDLSSWTLQNWFGIFLIFLWISRHFTRPWTNLQEKLDKDLYNYALYFTQCTLELLKSTQSSPWPAGRRGQGRSPVSWRLCRLGKRLRGPCGSPRSGRARDWRRGVGRRRGLATASGGGRGGSVDDGVEAKCVQISDCVSFTRG